jgi:hypothetical protein
MTSAEGGQRLMHNPHLMHDSSSIVRADWDGVPTPMVSAWTIWLQS